MALRVLQVAAEVSPFAKTGGLGDVVAGLSRFLERDGHDVRIFLPYYESLAREQGRYTPVDFIENVPVDLGSWRFVFSARTATLPDSGVACYFIDCPALFGKPGIYQGDLDDSIRFTLLLHAAFACSQRMGWAPDILHGHDWHTALLPLVRRAHYDWDGLFARSRTLLTIHNGGYQGLVPRSRLDELGLSKVAALADPLELAAGRLNCLKAGLWNADAVNAVSRTYAKELLTPELGCDLDGILRARGDRFGGIVNGVDYGEWDPASDPHLPFPYSSAELAGKEKNKQQLLAEIGVAYQPGVPVVGAVSRLTAQKGFDLCFEVLPVFLAHRDFRFVALGSGEERYESFFIRLAQAFPGKAWFYRGFNNALAHRIEAAADIFLMPSKFEPCGLNQMYSLRYGTPPVVHKTGGLADTVELFDSSSGQGTGFVFDHFHADGLAWALDYALSTYRDPPAWRRLPANGMAKNFSWDVQGREYARLYRWLLG
jgi:starch synthase